ncbi:hypothetical protein EAF04_010389 [Stromatinia cepivora]|nr:hypothetical protein EAF04_010389 [Stromatinia cepivora]
MADGLQSCASAINYSNPGLDLGIAMPGIHAWEEIESELSEEKKREEANKSPTQKEKERQERMAQTARHDRRMQTRAAIEKQRGIPWNEERKKTDEAAKRLQDHIMTEERRVQNSKKWGTEKLKSKFHSKAKQTSIEAEAQQRRLELEKDFELARNEEEKRWLQELGEDRYAKNAKIHIERCNPSKSLLRRGGSCCEDCQYDSRLEFLEKEEEQCRLRAAYQGR